MQIQPSNTKKHKDLRGRERLYNVVTCLGNACPWTQSISSSAMLGYLESEVRELHEEISTVRSDNNDMGNPNVKNSGETNLMREAMVSELGDILFDCLMLEMMIRRDYDIGIDEAWQEASEKVERRTPYMEEWGDGISKARSVEEAEIIWQAVKKKEKAEAKARAETAGANTKNSMHNCAGENIQDNGKIEIRSKLPTFAPKGGFKSLLRQRLRRHGSAFGSVVIGFALGVLVTNKFLRLR